MIINRKYELYFLFLLLLPILVLRMNIESTRYCTPDSVYYLEVSKNILSGYGAVGPKAFDYNKDKTKIFPLYDQTPFGHPDLYKKEYFAIWPLGYPSCIVVVSYITKLSPLWASKLVNLLLLALCFFLLYQLFDGTSYLPMYYFGSFTMLEICSYTWSENLFIPFFLLFILALKKIHNSDKVTSINIILLSISLLMMCLARYASVIFYFVAFIFMVYYFKKKSFERVRTFFYGLVLSTTLLGLYLFNNYLRSGYMTGMPRVSTQDFTPLELIEKFFMGMFHQLHLIKQFRFSGTADMLLYLVLAALQLCLIFYIGYLLWKSKIVKSIANKSAALLSIGMLYLVFLVYMTFTSTIDPFDYRTLLPFSFPVMIVLLFEIEERLNLANQKKAILIVKLFFVFSMFMNLPKKYLLELLF